MLWLFEPQGALSLADELGEDPEDVALDGVLVARPSKDET